MITVNERISRKKRYGTGITKGDKYYSLNYRKGTVYSKKYPNRALYTKDPYLKKLYYLDDIRHFFDAYDEKSFNEQRDYLISEIKNIRKEYRKQHEQLVDKKSTPALVLDKRLLLFNDWIDRLLSISIDNGVENAVNILKQTKIDI